MNKDLSTRTPSAIADEINIIKSQAGMAVVFVRRSVFEIGKRLEEAKSLLPHGEWGKWLKENVDYSESTANNLMRIYREFGGEQIDMLTGTSDAEIFGTLSQSQMVELFSLPKPARREFVEEHREELESGEMSIKEMRIQIAKLKMEKEGAEEALAKSCAHIKTMEGDIQDLSRALDEERHKPAPEPVVQEVIVNQPSEEQMEAERKKIEADFKARWEEEEEKIRDEYEKIYDDNQEQITKLEDERDKAILEANNIESEFDEKLEKATATHKAELDKLTAEHNKKLAELEETYKKQIKASSSKGDGDALRIQIALETFRREVRTVTSILQKLKSAGEENKSEALQAQVERAVSNIIAEAGWTV